MGGSASEVGALSKVPTRLPRQRGTSVSLTPVTEKEAAENCGTDLRSTANRSRSFLFKLVAGGANDQKRLPGNALELARARFRRAELLLARGETERAIGSASRGFAGAQFVCCHGRAS